MTYVVNTVLAPAVGLSLNAKVAAEAEKVMLSSLSYIEDIWLNGDGHFLLGGLKPSIADLSLVCEIMQLEVTRFMGLTLRIMWRNKINKMKNKCCRLYACVVFFFSHARPLGL